MPPLDLGILPVLGIPSVLQPASEATNPFFSDEDAPDDAADDTNHP